jgi:hypothetical protein
MGIYNARSITAPDVVASYDSKWGHWVIRRPLAGGPALVYIRWVGVG